MREEYRNNKIERTPSLTQIVIHPQRESCFLIVSATTRINQVDRRAQQDARVINPTHVEFMRVHARLCVSERVRGAWARVVTGERACEQTREHTYMRASFSVVDGDCDDGNDKSTSTQSPVAKLNFPTLDFCFVRESRRYGEHEANTHTKKRTHT